MSKLEFVKDKSLEIFKNKGLILQLGQLSKDYARKIFIEKYPATVLHKLVPGCYLILVNCSKCSQCIQETLL